MSLVFRILGVVALGLLSSAAFADGMKDDEYNAVAHKVRKHVFHHQYKNGVDLNGPETKQMLARSFVGNLVKSSLSEIDAHLLFACGKSEMYDENSELVELGHGVSVKKFTIYQHASSFHLRSKFDTSSAKIIKQANKISRKHDKYLARYDWSNKYIKAHDQGNRIRDGVDVQKVALKCDSKLESSLSAHREKIAEFIDQNSRSRTEATVK